MQFEVYAKGLAALSVDCIVLGVYEDGEMSEEAGAIDSASGGLLKKLLGRGDFSGRGGETLLLTEVPGISASRALLTGLGTRKSFARKSWRRAVNTAITAVLRTRIASIAVAIERPPGKELDDYYFGRAIAEIVGSALYRVNDLKTGKKPKSPALQKVFAGPVKKSGVEDAERGLEHGEAISAAASAAISTLSWRRAGRSARTVRASAMPPKPRRRRSAGSRGCARRGPSASSMSTIHHRCASRRSSASPRCAGFTIAATARC